ncbi:ABC transporter permease [Uliginosibacterium sediminicola]|uniref:ABC transporter permease n=1 Tax=Uliginosibacterium sediminicola TaxID=2024550 RepID=A0ABU9Z1Y3_9RHOO
MSTSSSTAADFPPPSGRRTALRMLDGALRVSAQRLGNYLGFMLLAAVLWQLGIWLFHLPAYLLPGLQLIAGAFVEHLAEIAASTWLTLSATLLGLLMATFIAALLALLFMASPLLSEACMPLIIFVRTVPMIAIAPLLVLIFGRGSSNSIGMVALLSFFQILLAARQGFEAPTRNMLELMHTCGASFWQTLFKLRIPSAMTHLFTGLRIASASAILCAMFAEWLSGAPGLGSLILDAYSRQDFAFMWAAVVVGTTVSYLFFTATIALERAVHDWSS